MTRPTSLPPPGTRAARFATVGVGLLVLVPALGLAAFALDPPPDPFGGAPPAMLDLLAAPGIAGLVGGTLALGFGVAVGAILMGGLLAFAAERLDFAGRRWLAVATVLPLALPSYIIAGTAARSLSRGGFIGDLLDIHRFGGVSAAVAVLTVATAPYVQLVVRAALARSGGAAEEAARTLGASPWRAFRYGTLPTLRPALAYGGLVALLYAASDFGAVAVLDAPVLTWRLFEAVTHQDLARATLFALLLLAVVGPLYVGTRVLRGGEQHRAVANPRAASRRRPGWLLGSAIAVVAALQLGLGLVIPVLAQVSWVREGLRRGLDFAPLWEPVAHSTAAAAVAALVTAGLALGPAWGAGHRRGVWRTIGEQVAYLPSAVPGVLVAFGLLLSGLAVTRGLGHAEWYAPLLGSGVLLVAGWALRFLAEAFGPLRASTLQLDPRLWAAARVLGGHPRRYLRGVVAPALAPGAGAAVLVAFVAVLKELPVTLVLGSATGLRPLPYRIWDRYSEALWHDAGLAGLVLVAVALVAVFLTLKEPAH